jgi:hypothetical protein
MANVFTAKKWMALLLPSILTTATFFICLTFYNLMIAMIGLIVMLLLGMLIGNLLLKNPFRDLVEGKGILAINLDSTGILRPFIVNVEKYYIKGRMNKEQVMDIFNRDTINQMAIPVKTVNTGIHDTDKGELHFILSEEDYNKSRFAMLHYPVILWNNQLMSFITKDFISEQEKKIFAEHKILYLNRKLEELTSITRDFARYVVELTKPKEGFFANKWVWIIIIGFIGIVLLYLGIKFLPGLIGTGKAAVQTTGGVMSNVQTPPVTPLA